MAKVKKPLFSFNNEANEFIKLCLNGTVKEIRDRLSKQDIDINNTTYHNNNAILYLLNSKYEENLAKKYEIIKLLIEAGININHQNELGETALMVVDDLKIAELLIKSGADKNLKNVLGWNALAYALFKGNNEIVKLLTDEKDIKTIIKSLNIDINAGHYDLSTPLIMACREGNLELAKALIELGADVNLGNYEFDDDRPLLAVSWSNNLEIAKLLIEAGAEVNYLDAVDFNCLMFAINLDNSFEMKKLLVDSGVNVNAVDCVDGYTALLRACCQNDAKFVSYLIENGAEVNFKTSFFGEDALTFAVEYSDNLEIVKILLASGFNFDKQIGEKALKLAKELNKQDFIQFLEARLNNET